ncbi:hypothetical protein CPC16_004630 [Podila verticillata]|nr:hypothetical protein BGZ52_004126 [Haplosporangium bisporale]KAF9216495.1 hypothetical protein BGZ59_009406 [Podila verticillata]KAF9391028.1 hypothetical protein CPC16_004630 [Podila verticillata]KAI9231578.1 MAG: hypothetical protein BYD32DRAFT_430507 [Podila humilis]
MKFSIALALVAVASAAKHTSSGASNTTAVTSSGIATATVTSTTVIPIVTSITVGVPTVITTSVASPTPTTSTTPKSDGQNLASVPVKVLLAVGGGVAAIAQLF